MNLRQQLKEAAKRQLSGNWAMGVVGALIYYGISYFATWVLMIPYYISAIPLFFGLEEDTSPYAVFPAIVLLVMTVAAVGLIGVLAFGMNKYYLSFTRTKKMELADIFSGFKQFGKAVGLFLLMELFVCLWSFLFIIPGIVASYRYRMAVYLLIDNPQIGVLEALRRSKEMMYGHKWELFVTDLSFLGWALLAVFTCGIGVLWLLPYTMTTYANYYNVLSGGRRTDGSPVQGTVVGFTADVSRTDNPWDPEQ